MTAMGCMTAEGGNDLGQAVKLSLVSPPSQATPWWLVAWGHGRTGEVHSDRGHMVAACVRGEREDAGGCSGDLVVVETVPPIPGRLIGSCIPQSPHPLTPHTEGTGVGLHTKALLG